MVRVISEIADLNRLIGGQFILEGQVVLLGVRSLEIHLISLEGQPRAVYIRGTERHAGESVFERGETGSRTCRSPGVGDGMARVGSEKGEIIEEGIVFTQVRRSADVLKARRENPVGGVRDELGSDLVGQPDSRRQIIFRCVDETKLIAVGERDAIFSEGG